VLDRVLTRVEFQNSTVAAYILGYEAYAVGRRHAAQLVWL
jgi:hypothetical protein